MATILLSAAGAALGAGFGGTALGLSGAVIGRAVGATLGRAIDQRILGGGSEPVEVGRLDRFCVMGASEGTAIPRLWGRNRVAGQVIWASPFRENRRSSGGGKGAPRPKTIEFSYSVSLAVALCEGEILGVGRIWADGTEIAPSAFDLRIYLGSESQEPDAAIEADVGIGQSPAYRGLAYVVFENLDLAAFGNRVPQLSFEVIRTAQGPSAEGVLDFQRCIRAVSLIPGTGEYALATSVARKRTSLAGYRTLNVNTGSGMTDFQVSLDQLGRELPNCGSVSLVVSWFGNDLRCGLCQVRPKVEATGVDADGMPWTAGGAARAGVQAVPLMPGGRSVYGGTPSDASVIEAIAALRETGREVMFYPFILMDQLADNTLPDPYTGQTGQPALPWRGRITLNQAPGQIGSTDLTTAAAVEVAAFFGTASVTDFSNVGGQVVYSGPDQWGYRRFILHYAMLCQLAGGVDAFCIGSEMRGLTQIRGAGHSFPAVQALEQLAADVRSILGPQTKISYAADWSEYFGYHRDGNVYYHLDPLWASPNIDFVGIDNYMPLSDWRDGVDHADAGYGSIYDLGYLKSNVCGGEGFDWYYDSPEGIAAQLRKPIVDGEFGEDWIFRYKDLRSWWALPHHNRIGGVRETVPTVWLPQSKPIRFTEYGCAAIDKGTNEPNRFLDQKSSESGLPRASSGYRDDYMQLQYYRAMNEYWNTTENNPASSHYSGRMLDLERCHAWAWDARPFPTFPRQEDLWSDGENYVAGHWLNGRASSVPLDAVVREICSISTVSDVDTKALHGTVMGYSIAEITSARADIQPLSMVHAFDAAEENGRLSFASRGATVPRPVTQDDIVLQMEAEASLERTRLADAEMLGRTRLTYVSAEGDFAARVAEAVFPDSALQTVSQTEYPMLLTAQTAAAVTARWLSEARSGRDLLKAKLPPSWSDLALGSTVRLEAANYRIDSIEAAEAISISAVRVDQAQYDAHEFQIAPTGWTPFDPPAPVSAIFADLPLLRGSEVPHAPHLAVTAVPWVGSVGVWSSGADAGYVLNTVIEEAAIVGTTLTPLAPHASGLFDRGPALRVKIESGALSSVSTQEILNGANAIAIGDGSPDNWEILQFQEAVLVADRTYDLTLRLRGQSGTDGLGHAEWPIGSIIIALTPFLPQIDLLSAQRGILRFYRMGLADLGPSSPDINLQTHAFRGNGLRPYSVAHLFGTTLPTGDITLNWVRRTRIDGDTWDAFDAPLAEERELYEVVVRNEANAVLRRTTTPSAAYVYSMADQVVDGAVLPLSVSVAQISAAYGAGPERRVQIG